VRRWAVRYLSYFMAVALTLVVASAVSSLLGATAASSIEIAGGTEPGKTWLVLLFHVVADSPIWIVASLTGCLVFRSIAQFGWIHAVPWWVVGVNWGLAFALALGLLFAMISGWITPIEAAAGYAALLLTIGFGWHVFTQRWVHCPSTLDQNPAMEFD